jgi:hypothetical protein
MARVSDLCARVCEAALGPALRVVCVGPVSSIVYNMTCVLQTCVQR